MALDVDALCSQPKKLRKSLKKILRDSAPERVHKLRTHTRRFEAMVNALALDSRKNEGSLIRILKPLRRRAGQVRDMDVLTQFAARPQIAGEEECSIRLLEHLGAEREGKARKLEKKTRAEYAGVRKRLKETAKFLDKTLRRAGEPREKTSKNISRSVQWADQAAAQALGLEAELRNWPTLNRKNLHPFRLKVKKLRYVLQMAEKSDSRFVTALGEVKDAIGEWHDWQELSGIAKKVVEHAGCKLLQEIDRTTHEKFEKALADANRLRRDYLNINAKRRRRSGSAKKQGTRVSPGIVSASALAA
jgi:CHAD domain-containing protein